MMAGGVLHFELGLANTGSQSAQLLTLLVPCYLTGIYNKTPAYKEC